MFLANLIYVASQLKIHPAVDLNTSNALTSLQSKRKFIESLLAFIIPLF